MTRPLLRSAPTEKPSDVCLIAEGCYPHVLGGVSTWLDWLMRSQPHLTFTVVSILSGREERRPKYEPPPNLIAIVPLELQPVATRRFRRMRHRPASEREELVKALIAFVRDGTLARLENIVAVMEGVGRPFTLDELTDSHLTWEILTRMYREAMPHASFLAFHWAWRALFGGMFATLTFPLPQARAYHATCTGYAGLLAARAHITTGRAALLTEHGIYTNERRIEILMADWISDQVDKGFSLVDARMDLRDLWIETFEAYARVCYAACRTITSLYSDNKVLQATLGAPSDRLRVIPNGIEIRCFESLDRPDACMPPTMAFVGRVVPIKDVKTFIAAAANVRLSVPEVKALVLGPLDEDPAYAEECRALVAELGLERTVEFVGRVNVVEWLPRVHVVVLTSLSEAQPLTLLEAGAAGIPCVATDVGSCREILEGRADEWPRIGPGGFVCELVSPTSLAKSISRLLCDPDLRVEMGDRLRRRVRTLYSSERSGAAYSALYAEAFVEEEA